MSLLTPAFLRAPGADPAWCRPRVSRGVRTEAVNVAPDAAFVPPRGVGRPRNAVLPTYPVARGRRR